MVDQLHRQNARTHLHHLEEFTEIHPCNRPWNALLSVHFLGKELGKGQVNISVPFDATQ